jgi:hypothetical protein
VKTRVDETAFTPAPAGGVPGRDRAQLSKGGVATLPAGLHLPMARQSEQRLDDVLKQLEVTIGEIRR